MVLCHWVASTAIPQKDYTINGSVYNIGYTYSLNRSSVKYFDYDDNAKYEVDEVI